MRRREFITLLGGAASWPLAANAQQAQGLITHARIAFLGAESASTNQHFLDAFRQGMREHDYVGGQNVTFLERWAEGRSESFPELIDELLQAQCDSSGERTCGPWRRRAQRPRPQSFSSRAIPWGRGSSPAWPEVNAAFLPGAD